MLKVFIGELLPNIPHTEILFPNLGNVERENPFGEKIFTKFTEPVVEIVDKPEACDYFCLPHNYNYAKKHADYVEKFSKLAATHSKKVLVFFPGDSDEEIVIPNAIIFRNSQYGYKKKLNEIIMPGFAADLGEKYGVTFAEKTEKPVVGFCGWAHYRSFREWISYVITNLRWALAGKPVHKKGLYFRRKALALLGKSDALSTNFIIRTSYSGNKRTIEVDPKIARMEYVENIKNSDFTLAPKGDGNFSVRFFESLSLARIPLLIDTDCPLPLEDRVDYSGCILRIRHDELSLLPEKVVHFYNTLTPEEYLLKQKRCREVFEKYLKIDVFFRCVLTKEFLS